MVVYEVRVSLLGAEPAVWRRIRIPGDAHLGLVHMVIHMVMGWENMHLHEFEGGEESERVRYGPIDGDEDSPDVLDEREYLLSDLLREPKDRCLYCYDFGDDWQHEVVLEKVSEIGEDDDPLWCLGGRGACPPEDCGGVPGYLMLLESFKDVLDEEEHDAAVQLLGEGFQPEAFDCSEFNDQVKNRFSGSRMKAVAEVEPGEEFLMELQDFLSSDALPEGAMSMLALDGLFSALAVHPVTIMPSRWLPLVWDMEAPGRQPDFASKAEMEKGMGLIYAYFNAVVRQLTNDPDNYLPLCENLQFEPGEERMQAAADWSAGFLLGTMIDEDVWTRTYGDEEGRRVMTPFALLSGVFDEESEVDENEMLVMKEEMIDELGGCVLDLQEYWQPWREAYLAEQGLNPTVRGGRTPGRNDPCPCGSGKKYKKCCGGGDGG
jgi:uncharacterized protein